MNAQDAAVVAKDSETRRNEKKQIALNSVECPACGRTGDYRKLTNHLETFHDLEKDQLQNALGLVIKSIDREIEIDKACE